MFAIFSVAGFAELKNKQNKKPKFSQMESGHAMQFRAADFPLNKCKSRAAYQRKQQWK